MTDITPSNFRELVACTKYARKVYYIREEYNVVLIHCNQGKVSFPISNNTCAGLSTNYSYSTEPGALSPVSVSFKGGNTRPLLMNTGSTPAKRPDSSTKSLFDSMS